MIKFNNTQVFGWQAAIRGMRNPLNSWDKSDSYETHIEDDHTLETALFGHFVGDDDLQLAKQLAGAGDDHGKFLRFINVTVDITAPLYWWKEFDTYKIGTVCNSTSTMHTIHKKPLTSADFSCEHMDTDSLIVLQHTIENINYNAKKFRDTQDKQFWWQIIQTLPSSFNQLRTIQLNYQVLKHMYHARKNHKLDEWNDFCNWCETLPYFKDVCIYAK